MAIIIKMGHVEEINTDPSGSLRIKARTKEDGSNEVPWAFPLIPKQFQVVPKVGEGVFIINEDDNRKESNRYYIGPIISQPQFNEESNFNYGRGVALSALQGRAVEPLPNIENDKRTLGSFPKLNSVSVVGRESQDIIMQKNSTGSEEINIRCGIRKESADGIKNSDGVINNVGKIIFNDIDPAYIQLKYKNNLGSAIKNYNAEAKDKIEERTQTNSAINIVADKINLVSVNDDSIHVNKTDRETLIKDGDMDNLMSQLHQLPKGDILVELLKIMRDALLTHTHNYNGLPPTIAENMLTLNNFDLNDILSQYVRIS